jgi:hypothetical protein
MRIFVTRAGTPTDPDTLWRELLKRPGTRATAEAVKAFNPHVRFDRELAPGTVLLIPDATDLKEGAGIAVTLGDINQIAADVADGLKTTVGRTRAGLARMQADHAAVATALKAAGSKRLIDSDPELKKQLQAVEARVKTDVTRATESASQLADLQKLAEEELGKLRKLLTR